MNSYRAPLSRSELGIVDIFFGIFAHHPLWMKLLLIVRNKVASLAGLDTPTASEILHLEIKDRYVVGEKIGVWPIFSLSEDEVVAGRNNKHMDFRLSVLKLSDRVVDVGLMLIEARLDIEVRNELHKPVDVGQLSRAPCDPTPVAAILPELFLLTCIYREKTCRRFPSHTRHNQRWFSYLSVTSVVPRANSSTSLTPLIMGPFR